MARISKHFKEIERFKSCDKCKSIIAYTYDDIYVGINTYITDVGGSSYKQITTDEYVECPCCTNKINVKEVDGYFANNKCLLLREGTIIGQVISKSINTMKKEDYDQQNATKNKKEN